MGLALRLAFYGMIGLQVFVLMSLLRRYDFIDRAEKGIGQSSMTEANEIDSFVSSMAGISILASLAIFALLITWLFNVTRSNRIKGAKFSNSDAWAIGGFFLPVANLFIPYKFLKENLEFTHGDHREITNLIRYLNIWWFGYLATVALRQVASNMSTETLSSMKTSDGTSIVASLVLIVACVFAGFVVDTLSPKVK